MSENGILFIDKPIGMTSREVDNKIGKLFHTRSVGHLGTLDPFASGLLILGVNKGNKYLPFLGDERKTYVATLELGSKTSTGDPTGEIVEQKPYELRTFEEINRVLQGFLGKGSQIPPMTSAIKMQGKALYELAHEGKTIEREPRPIEIFEIRLLEVNLSGIRFECSVSAGTYIRVLGEDIAVALGTVGHLISLRRTCVGGIEVGQAKRLDAIEMENLLEPSPYLCLPKIAVEGEKAKKIRNGMTIIEQNVNEARIVYTENGIALAVYEQREPHHYHCLRGLA